jgi:hypothetical protein
MEERIMRRALLVSLMLFVSAQAYAADAPKKGDANAADPLAKFSDEDLADPAFCFRKLVDALGRKDAPLVKALLADVPRALQGLNLAKEDEKARFLAAFSGLSGASIVSVQRLAMAGVAQLKYTDAKGAEKEARMQNCGGRWKLVPD